MTWPRLWLLGLLGALPLVKLAQFRLWQGDDAKRQAVLIVGCALVTAICMGSVRRGLAAVVGWQVASPGTEPVRRAVAWSAAPGAVVLGLLGAVATGVVDLDPKDGCTLGLASGDLDRALCTVVVIGVGEEYLYRGVLMILAIRARLDQWNFLLLSVGFGAWHLVDKPFIDHAVLGRALPFAATFAASHLVLFVARLRGRSILAPAFIHGSVNLAILIAT